jgi:hypothetical protein
MDVFRRLRKFVSNETCRTQSEQDTREADGYIETLGLQLPVNRTTTLQ